MKLGLIIIIIIIIIIMIIMNFLGISILHEIGSSSENYIYKKEILYNKNKIP